MRRTLAHANSRLFAVLLLVVGLTIMSGCTGTNKDANNKPASPKYTIKVEPRPEDSGEIVRKHKIDEAGRTVETEITYRNGERAQEIYRLDGSLAERNEFYKAGQIRRRTTMSENGKTISQLNDYRADGTLKFRRQTLPDGRRLDVVYWSDGKHKFSECLVEQSDARETKYFNKSGALIARKLETGARGILLLQEQFDENGNLVFKSEFNDPGETLTIFRPDGTVEMRQICFAQKSGWWQGSTLQTVEIYDSSGTRIVMKIHMNISGYPYGSARDIVDFVEIFLQDGSRVVNYYHHYGDDYLIKKEIFDPKDNLQSSESWDYYYKGPLEPVDKRHKTRFEGDDPVKTWELEEAAPDRP